MDSDYTGVRAIPDRGLRKLDSRPSSDAGASHEPRLSFPQERDDASRGARSLGGARSVRGGPPGSAIGLEGMAGQPRAKSQAATTDDDGGAKGPVRAGPARRTRVRVC